MLKCNIFSLTATKLLVAAKARYPKTFSVHSLGGRLMQMPTKFKSDFEVPNWNFSCGLQLIPARHSRVICNLSRQQRATAHWLHSCHRVPHFSPVVALASSGWRYYSVDDGIHPLIRPSSISLFGQDRINVYGGRRRRRKRNNYYVQQSVYNQLRRSI